MIIHYVYYSYEPYGRGYIGKHKLDLSSGKTPQNDGYYGSSLDKTFKPTKKIILEILFSEEDAYNKEREYQECFDVINNENFANRSIQKTSGFYFDRTGIPHKEEIKQKISETMKKRRQDPEMIEKYSKLFDGEKNPRYIGDKYSWKNLKTQEIVYNATVLEMEAKYPNLKRSSLYNVKNNKIKSYKGWIIYNANQKPDE